MVDSSDSRVIESSFNVVGVISDEIKNLVSGDKHCSLNRTLFGRNGIPTYWLNPDSGNYEPTQYFDMSQGELIT